MTSTYSKVKSIAEDLQLSESKTAMVLYLYLTYCLQELILSNESHTIFGNLKLNDKDRLTLESSKFGLIDLLGKKDIKLIRKIIEDGPDTKIF